MKETFFSAFRIFFGLLSLVIFLAVIYAIFFLPVYESLSTSKYQPHPQVYANVFGDPSKKIKEIRLAVFYAVPADKKESAIREWKPEIEEKLEKIAKFHNLQFRGTSVLNFKIYPEIVFLEREDFFYNPVSEVQGNPRTLISVGEEIDRRVFLGGGDLYRKDFIQREEGIYQVMGIIYEGEGSWGGIIYDSELNSASEFAKSLGHPESLVFPTEVRFADGFFMIGRIYLTSGDYDNNSASLIYHEFAHAIGFPDRYDLKTGQFFSDDIMGSGRLEQIEDAYIADTSLIKTNVLPEQPL